MYITYVYTHIIHVSAQNLSMQSLVCKTIDTCENCNVHVFIYAYMTRKHIIGGFFQNSGRHRLCMEITNKLNTIQFVE